MCIDKTVFSQTLYTLPILVQCLASVANVGVTLKQHWVDVSFEKYLVISLVANINAVDLYYICYCRPTRDQPTHARFAVKWFCESPPLIKQGRFNSLRNRSSAHRIVWAQLYEWQ